MIGSARRGRRQHRLDQQGEGVGLRGVKDPRHAPCSGTWEGSFRPGGRTGAAWERRKPDLMMDETKPSDSSIVAMKRANKEGRPSAEPVERRDGTKGNSVRPSTRRTQRRGSVSQAVDRIRRAIARNPKERLTAFEMHPINVEALRRAYLGLRKDAAPGIDGVRWEEYGAKREERLLDLHRRVTGAVPSAARPAIPKPDGRTRLCTILQKAGRAPDADYEAEFLGLSCSASARTEGAMTRWMPWPRDRTAESQLDRGRGFGRFSMLDRDRLLSVRGRTDRRPASAAAAAQVAERRRDGRGDLVGPGVLKAPSERVPALCAGPVVPSAWRPRVPGGEAILVYADDFVAGFSRRADAVRFLRDLGERSCRCTRKRRDWWSLGRFAEADRRDAGSGNRRRSIFWGSRTIARRLGRGDSGWGGSGARNG